MQAKQLADRTAYLKLAGESTAGVAAEASGKADTAVALAAGATEANPLGLVLLPAKFALHRYAKTLPEAEQPAARPADGAVTHS